MKDTSTRITDPRVPVGTAVSQYVIGYPVVLTADDKAQPARRFIRDVMALVASKVLQHWLANPGTYHINIAVTMEKQA